MANYKEQFNYTGQGPLDLKQNPVVNYETLIDLKRIPLTQRYEGLTVTVLNSDTTKLPCEYWLIGGRTNSAWKLKSGIVADYESLTKIAHTLCMVGLTITVKEDEKANGEVSEYIVTKIEGETVTWTRKIRKTDFITTIEDTVDMLLNKKYGNVVYTTDSIYSYEDESGETMWTAHKEEIPEGVEYKTYTDGLYTIKEDEEGNVSFEEIATTKKNGVVVDGDDEE